MSVFIPIPVEELAPWEEQSSRTYMLDIERGRIFSAGSCDGLEAVNQFIKKTLLTPRFRCLIYDNQYGSEIKQTIIAANVTSEYVETEIPRLVLDACLVDSRVLEISDFSFEFENDKAHIRFRANTIFGETVVEEVI